MPTITGTEIDQWAEQVDASSALPDLIRRLILATAKPRSVDFPADGGTRLSGWDGIVITNDATGAFCPEGRSFWELSTSATVAAKLNKDFSSRPPDAAASYVGVTARRFPSKREWRPSGAEKWAAVRALDADDIATWLSQAPVVATWFSAIHLGRPENDLCTIDQYLEGWRSLTTTGLPTSLLLLGSERAQGVQRVLEWTRSPPSRLTIAAHTMEEAVRFAAAALQSAPAEDGHLSRTLAVQSPSALRWAERQQGPLILLATFDTTAEAISSRHHLLIPLAQQGSRRADISVDRIPHRLLEKALGEAGVPDAERLAQESRGSLPSLLRLLGAPTTPEWSSSPSRPLLALLLAGQWTLKQKADADAVATFAHASVAEIEALCVRMSTCPDPPIQLQREEHRPVSWRWSAPRDAWTVLAPQLTDGILADFHALAVQVMGDENTSYSMESGRRFMAPIAGKGLRFSSPLRRGVAESLARLSLSDNELRLTSSAAAGSTIATSVVRTVLRADWIAWASVGRVLPTLAEAAPHAFLVALRESLDEREVGAAHLFAEEGPFSSPHTALLFALEGLAWSGERLQQVCKLLARLAAVDPGGNLSNRPASSLVRILHPLMPATNATAEQRASAVRLLCKYHADVAWPLMIDLLDVFGFGGMVMPAHKPEFLVEAPCQDRAVSGEEISAFAEVLLAQVLEQVADDVTRWSQLVALRVSDDLRERILGELSRRVDAGSFSESTSQLWSAVRTALHWAYMATDEGKSAEADLLRHLYAALTPADVVGRVAWLFEPSPQVPEAVGDDWEAQQERIRKLQRAALVELWTSAEEGSDIARLAASCSEPIWLGVVAAQMPFGEELERRVFDEPSIGWARLRPGFFAVCSTKRGMVWTREYLQELVTGGRIDDAVQAASLLSRRSETWDAVADIGEPLRIAYWKRDGVVYPEDAADAERSVAELLAVGERGRAFDVAGHFSKNLSTNLVLRVLSEFLEDEARVRSSSSSYLAQQLFERLEAAKDIPDEVVMRLELGFFAWLTGPGSRRPKLRLFAGLRNSPEFFVMLLNLLYRPQQESLTDAPSATESTEQRQAAAQNARQVIYAWKDYPGYGLKPLELETSLRAWCRTVFELAKEADRLEQAEREVVRLLARVPAAPDGHWPCETARDLLEGDRAHLRSALAVAKRNQRGMVGKAIFEGGSQEAELARGFKDSAAALRIEGKYPETSALLDDLAETYALEARQSTIDADAERLDAGYDRGQAV